MVAVIIMMIIMINIDIFTNGLIDIDMFKNHAININIFKKCRYGDNQYFLLIYIYRTPLGGGGQRLFGTLPWYLVGCCLGCMLLVFNAAQWASFNSLRQKQCDKV